MAKWKSHVRAGLFQRDCMQKDPFDGVFKKLAHLGERLQIQEEFWTESCNEGDGQTTVHTRRLQFHLKESEHMREKLAQTVSDLTSVFYLKEAELLYWQSQVSRYRKEALTLAKGASSLQAKLADCEFSLENQSKELAALREEQEEQREALGEARREKEQLLERWMEEKREEAERVNRNNAVQERWHRFTRRLNRHLSREMEKQTPPRPTSAVGTESSSSSALQRDQPAAETENPAVTSDSLLWNPN